MPTLRGPLATSTSDDSKSVRIEGWRSTDVVSAATLLHLALVIMDQIYTLRVSGLRLEWPIVQLKSDCSDYCPWLACFGFCAGEQLERIGFDD